MRSRHRQISPPGGRKPESARRPRRWGRLLLAVLLLLGPWCPAKEKEKAPKARVKVTGLGLFSDLELKKLLRLARRGQAEVAAYNANQVEDMAILATAFARDAGYLDPAIQIRVTLTNDSVQHFAWKPSGDDSLPRSVMAKEVRFEIHRGVLFYYDRLDIEGLRALPAARGREFFLKSDALLSLKQMRVYTPDLLRRSREYLRDALNRRGYESARVEVAQLDLNPTNGAVQVRIQVEEGIPSIARSVEVQTFSADRQESVGVRELHPMVPYSGFWSQELLQGLRTNEYRRGFPDAVAELTESRRETNANRIELDLVAKVYPGTNIHIRNVRFEGPHRTRPSVLERFGQVQPGETLDRIRVEQGRERLSRLGVFESVGLRYDVVEPDYRDVVFELRERKTFEIRLIGGYGSYDRLGGGFEVAQHNILGRAHQADFKAVQTFKSSTLDGRYTVPEVLWKRVDAFVSGSLLRREEIGFTREDYGGAIGLHRYFRRAKLDASLRYEYQFLNARSSQFEVLESIGVAKARASAIVLEMKHDRLDNPLSPRRGYRLSSTLETAADALGGEVNYQRIQLGAAGHWDLGGGRVIHLGASHGMTFTAGGPSRDLPFDRRFFPGGENSIRGFQYGEAAPRDSLGRLIGAETFLLGNAEFEQYLTRSISVVGFADALGMASDRRDYPFNQALYSVGGGLRWMTVIGPVRLEYGHNLNPREWDPSGTLHFSFGFPF